MRTSVGPCPVSVSPQTSFDALSALQEFGRPGCAKRAMEGKKGGEESMAVHVYIVCHTRVGSFDMRTQFGRVSAHGHGLPQASEN